MGQGPLGVYRSYFENPCFKEPSKTNQAITHAHTKIYVFFKIFNLLHYQQYIHLFTAKYYKIK